MKEFLLIFTGGGFGSVTRYTISKLISYFNLTFPIATLLSNLISCLILGLTLYFIQHGIKQISFIEKFIIFGFCGGLSTFSTFSIETFRLLKNDMFLFAILNILFNIFLCFSVFYIIFKK